MNPIKRFLRGELDLLCKTHEIYDLIMLICETNGITWAYDEAPTAPDNYQFYESQTYITTNGRQIWYGRLMCENEKCLCPLRHPELLSKVIKRDG